MDESLRRWCTKALDAAQRCVGDSAETLSSEDMLREAEQIVNRLAFQKILEARGFSSCLVARLISSIPADLVKFAGMCPLQPADPPDVLGEIHQWLVARRAAVVSKQKTRTHRPRKSGGVFYTPACVVDEIVQGTVGQRLASLPQSDWNKIRILDPAAGCGAFLVGAYRFLIRRTLDEFAKDASSASPDDFGKGNPGERLPFDCARRLLIDQIFGVDLDPGAVDVTRRILWLTMLDASHPESESTLAECLEQPLTTNIRCGNALTGQGFDFEEREPVPANSVPEETFDWWKQFPQVCEAGGFDVVIGNPPYRREKDFKHELDAIVATDLGRRHRTARMDLWYYFLHRGIELLKSGGALSFITTAYWLQGWGADSVISALRDDVHLDELFLLRDLPVFPGVTSQHVIFRVTKRPPEGQTLVRVLPRVVAASVEPIRALPANELSYSKTHAELFHEAGLNVLPAADELLTRFERHVPLGTIGRVRQGIAENPASINRRTLERFQQAAVQSGWQCGEGVFSLLPDEVERLSLSQDELKLLRPYHDLCDLGRYWAASVPSRQLIYSTRDTCPDIEDHSRLYQHLNRFRVILDARRETQVGTNRWWHLHWPRAEEIWHADKLVVVQMAPRPSFVPLPGPSYVPFSVNVFVPATDLREDLRYLCGLLNSRPLWAWFLHHAKRRGIGLELNGHVLEKCPIRRIDFDDPVDAGLHQQIVNLVQERLCLAQRTANAPHADPTQPSIQEQICSLESQLDALVSTLYGLSNEEIQLIEQLTDGEF